MATLTDYKFELPDILIADKPLPDRSGARMLCVDRKTGTFNDSKFEKFSQKLNEGDLLVVNNTRVFPARLFGKTATGASVEILLVRELDGQVWEALAKPAKRLRPGGTIEFGDGLSGDVLERPEGGTVRIKFRTPSDLFEHLQRIGKTPLPPYIKRHNKDPDIDRERYQTVFAKDRGAIAAPTAGLHFTKAILDKIRSRGIEIVEITLHVGYGTFEPVRSEDLSQHRVLPEQYSIDEKAARFLNSALDEGRRIVAVGTTTTRLLEHQAAKYGEFIAKTDYADLTIIPGHKFRAVGGLLTNFHLPQSSLLILVSAFAGRELIMNAYKHAVECKYRFYSYGDCMFIT